MTTIIKKTLHVLILPVLMTSLAIHSMEITPKNTKPTGVLQFDPTYHASGYVGYSLRKTMEYMSINIAPRTECIMMIGHINIDKQLSLEEMEFLYQETVQTKPILIEAMKARGMDPRTTLMEEFSKPTALLTAALPVTKIMGLHYGDTFDLNGIEISFHDTPTNLKVLRKAGKRVPEIFTLTDEDFNELINQEIITINPHTGVIKHGRCGSGTKEKSIQNNSDR